MTEIFTAKTVEEAKALAARHFGAKQENISFEILEEPKKGFFRMKGDARVKATYISVELPAQESAPQIVDTTAHIPAQEITVQEAPVQTEEPVKEEVSVQEEASVQTQASAAEETTEEEAQPAGESSDAPENPRVQAYFEAEPTSVPEKRAEEQRDITDEELIAGEPSEQSLAKIEKAKAYLLSILEKMGVEAKIEVRAGAESAILDIQAPDNGMVIGRRGETLDALQYLTFMIANRGDREYYRIILNSAGYRDRRRKTLEELAAKVARNVLKTGRQTTLEPMNPYERRIIHSAVSRIEGVVSRSIGEEPYRKVVISSLKPRRSRKPGDRPEKRNQNRRRDHHRDENVASERTSMDFMKTSFEKDYKRPKPEDDIHAGLYGKIEI